MIARIEDLLANNKAFVAEQLRLDPSYFDKLAQGQHPEFLWIGCSDSRVPPDRITSTREGDMFVHRNIANLVVQTDMNLLSVLQYAVDVLQVKHVIVCGHYGCGGVKAAMGPQLATLDEHARFDRLVELNVVEQVYNLGKTSIIQDAWTRGGHPFIHGWVFDLASGYIRPQTSMINNNDAILEVCKFHNGIVGQPAIRAAA
jgi:carbonic anhydrase